MLTSYILLHTNLVTFILQTLEQELIMTRAQYECTDSGKSKRPEATHEVANLIDDYKKVKNARR